MHSLYLVWTTVSDGRKVCQDCKIKSQNRCAIKGNLVLNWRKNVLTEATRCSILQKQIQGFPQPVGYQGFPLPFVSPFQNKSTEFLPVRAGFVRNPPVLDRGYSGTHIEEDRFASFSVNGCWIQVLCSETGSFTPARDHMRGGSQRLWEIQRGRCTPVGPWRTASAFPQKQQYGRPDLFRLQIPEAVGYG
jgi:hypothetical protein